MSAVDDRESVLARLRARAAEPDPESWKPSGPGDSIVGTFRRLERGTTAFGDAWLVVVESLANPGRLARVWLFHETLRNALKKAAPRPGEVVLIAYEGRREPQGGGQPYHMWRVVVDRDEETAPRFTWNDVAGDGGAEPHPLEQAPAAAPASDHATGDAFADFPAASADVDDIPF